MVYIYLRASTGRQTLDTQRFQAENFCTERNITPDHWICENVSGAKKASDRKLGELIESLQTGDTLIVTELSRLGRSFYNVIVSINTCLEKQVTLYAIKGGYTLANDIQSKVIVFAFSLAAEIEREMIISRTKTAIERKRSEGKSWGRQKGFKLSTYKLDEKVDLIRSELAKKTSFRQIGKLDGVDPRTVQKYAENLR